MYQLLNLHKMRIKQDNIYFSYDLTFLATIHAHAYSSCLFLHLSQRISLPCPIKNGIDYFQLIVQNNYCSCDHGSLIIILYPSLSEEDMLKTRSHVEKLIILSCSSFHIHFATNFRSQMTSQLILLQNFFVHFTI